MLALAFGAALAAAAPSTADQDWSRVLREDAKAVHDAIAENHPGPHDALNPDFRRVLQEGYARAVKRAEGATTRGHYWWALREFVAGFDDGHTALSATDKLPNLNAVWPGFYTVYRNGRHEAAVRAAADAPPLVAALLECDGRSADALAADTVGRFRGSWSLQTSRRAYGEQLFRHAENPYLHRPARCTFEKDGVRKTYTLSWVPYDDAARAAVQVQIASLPGRALDPIGMRPFGRNGWWITASSFNSDPESKDARSTTALIAELAARRDEVRKADRIVFDLRGNNGGSSHWSHELALALWGTDYVAARIPANQSYVEWRASPGNVAHVYEIRDRFKTSSPETSAWAGRNADGMAAALARGEALWREKSSTDAPGAAARPVANLIANPVAGRIYVLTDFWCGSACLDAADLWLALDAVQIGEETFADSQYMEVRDFALPSGYGRLFVPTKVYRDRPRAPGQTLKPRHAYVGDMRDTKALEAWVETLP